MEISKKALEHIVYDSFDGPNSSDFLDGVKYSDFSGKSEEWKNGYKQGSFELKMFILHNIRYFEDCTDSLLIRLIELGVGFWDGSEHKFSLNMNDQFAWGCADCEELNETEYREVLRLFDLYGDDGLIYWVAEKRGHDPVREDSDGHERNWRAVQAIREKEKNNG